MKNLEQSPDADTRFLLHILKSESRIMSDFNLVIPYIFFNWLCLDEIDMLSELQLIQDTENSGRSPFMFMPNIDEELEGLGRQEKLMQMKSRDQMSFIPIDCRGEILTFFAFLGRDASGGAGGASRQNSTGVLRGNSVHG